MVRSAADALVQSVELAVAAEEAGADGAYYRVHHFAQQLASPFPLLAAAGLRRIEPHSPGLRDRSWWGAGTRATAEWAAEEGLNLMSSTLLTEDTGVPFHRLQAEQIQRFRDAWKAAGHAREPRVSVSRSIFPIVNDIDRQLFWQQRDSTDQVGWLDGGTARFGRTYAGEPDKLVAELA